MTKRCSKCKDVKDISEFYPDKYNGHQSMCKVCHKVRTKAYQKGERYKEYKRKWRKTDKHKETQRRYMATYKPKAYGLTPEQRELLAKEQDNRCLICGSNTDLQIDHDHRTNKIRGMLCGNCNSVLGFAKDNPVVLLNAIRYLESV